MSEQRKLAAVMFTDIVGYTLLMSKDEQKALAILDKNRMLQKDLAKKHSGEFLKEMGDGTLLCFQSALDAVRCAMEIQEAVKDDPNLNLRIGIHLGDIVFKEGDVFGDGVNVASRIERLAETGGICISEQIYLLLRNQPEIDAVFLGEKKLKNVDHPVKIYQIVDSGSTKKGMSAFFEEKEQSDRFHTLSRKHNLPSQLTSFIGREKEIETVLKLLSENRLVTLTGVGGCGKTRLAVKIAEMLIDEFGDGAWFINLAPISDANFIPLEISKVLEIKAEPNKAIIDTLIENINNMKLLILLDNCEHLVQTCAEIADRLLRSVKGMRILATSREPLNTQGEVPWRVPSFSIPDNGSNKNIDEVIHYEAVKLFTDRAFSSKPGFNLNPQNISFIIRVCQHLDGIPLAIELAAARIRHLSLETILERLGDRMTILASSSRTVPERQQNLQATIDWSYDLLTDEEQRLFNRLSVFTSDFNIEAVEGICTDDELKKENVLSLLCQLVDKSLVIAEDQEDESVRYRYLVPLQQYSLQKLKESGEEEKYRKHHLSYFLKIAEQAYEERLESQPVWLTILEVEHDNLIAALNWSDDLYPDEFVKLSGALAWFWWMRSHFLLGKDYLEKALLKKIDKSEEYAPALFGLGMILWFTGDNQTRAINLMIESLNIWRKSNNLKEEAYVLGQLSFSYCIIGDHETGIKCSERSLDIAKKVRNPNLINHCLTYLCTSLVCSKKFDQAKPMVKKLLVSSEELKQPFGILRARHYISDCALADRNFKDAEKKYALAVKTSIKYGDIVQATHDLHGIAFSISGQSRWAKAIRLNGAVCKKYRIMGISMPISISFWAEWVDIYIEGAKKQVGKELTRKYEKEGRNMGFEAAVEYALDFDRD